MEGVICLFYNDLNAFWIQNLYNSCVSIIIRTEYIAYDNHDNTICFVLVQGNVQAWDPI